MEKYHVQITDAALADMAEIYRYIAGELQSPENAAGQYDRIAKEILTLERFPERYRIMDFPLAREKKLRRMLVDHYSVFYVVRQESVLITNVLYSASNLEERLNAQQ